ncbi:MAG: helix-turn-helix transcriptional regulator [Oscillibacter sp.]|nr:helix-turn-helix transcriptional regulator [Oscillibacter sp.]MBD5169661.1 helix-turn-helix transcriptional regulator [Oscillibacter sp.]
MNADFSRVLSLLRQEKGISQRKAAAALGISQALLSHYENGIREPGLNFVTKACDYYHVSADYLLGRSLNRDGAVIEAEELVDASEGKEDLKGSVAAKFQKKLIVNTTSVLFDLLGRTNNKEAASQAGAYLSGALYQLIRPLYRAAGGNDSYFSTGVMSFDMDVMAADMTVSRIRYAKALEEYRGVYPPVDSQSLEEEYQGLSQSMAQVLHGADERAKKLEE